MERPGNQEVHVNPDPQLVAALRHQLARLSELEATLSARAAHPPRISSRDWAGPAAEAHTRASAELRRRLRLAEEAVFAAAEATREELARAGG
jgi:hypothetical protein